MKKTSQQYLNSEAHGYLMEAKACKLLLKDLERIRAKLRRHKIAGIAEPNWMFASRFLRRKRLRNGE